MKWVSLTCLAFAAWQIWLVPIVSSHTDLWISTVIGIVAQCVAGMALVLHYFRGALSKSQLITGLMGLALCALGTALLYSSGSAGSVGDALLVLCGLAVWIVLILWIIIRALVRLRAPHGVS
ncbi:hypothetical protein GCM10010974_27150 [Brevibacterium sediminis]|uniref:Uncharacterized protein n=2 Tax=Brevibacteriaceae TaxID=85019 RepID=A0ABQ1MR89_9MICO|nr:hypothetical protein GCM10010974_27150 [Brevibacterium sediminis]